MKIHQGKTCKKKDKVQLRGSEDRKTSREIPQDSNHRGNKATVEQRKKKIQWPKASEVEKYEQFDKDVSAIVQKQKGTIEQRITKLAEAIHNEGEKRFGLENNSGPETRQRVNISRRQEEITRIRKEKKLLRSRWIKSNEQEREGLMKLYEDIKKKHRDLLRKERRLKRKKEKEKIRREFVNNPFEFAKGIFTTSKSGTLKCTKEELENHLKEKYSDHRREERLPFIHDLIKPDKPVTPFDMTKIKEKEMQEFITKARSKGSPGNDGVSYKVYKKCPRLRNMLLLLLRKMWKAKRMAEKWQTAEGIYLPKEEKSENIGQFRPISLLNIDGKIFLGIIARRIINFVRANGYVNESVQKAGMPRIPGCIEHAYAIWEEIRRAKDLKSDISVIWLDLENAYGSVPHVLIQEAMEFFWFPKELKT